MTSTPDCLEASLDQVASCFSLRDGVPVVGYTFKQATLSVASSQWSDLMDVNLISVLRACRTFYDNLACEWTSDGISVNAVAPGVFTTDLNGRIVQGTARGREILMRTPMRRFGSPRELVGAAVLLASDAATFINGQCIVIDGGYLASGGNS